MSLGNVFLNALDHYNNLGRQTITLHGLIRLKIELYWLLIFFNFLILVFTLGCIYEFEMITLPPHPPFPIKRVVAIRLLEFPIYFTNSLERGLKGLGYSWVSICVACPRPRVYFSVVVCNGEGSYRGSQHSHV